MNQFRFDADQIMEHGPTRVAVMEARSRGLASGSDERVIREVMARIANNEHGTLKLSGEAADGIAANILIHSVHDEPALATLKELAHERFHDTIGKARGRAERGGAGQEGEEPGPLAYHRARSRGAGGDRGTAQDARGEGSEGPELAGRVTRPSPSEQLRYTDRRAVHGPTPPAGGTNSDHSTGVRLARWFQPIQPGSTESTSSSHTRSGWSSHFPAHRSMQYATSSPMSSFRRSGNR